MRLRERNAGVVRRMAFLGGGERLACAKAMGNGFPPILWGEADGKERGVRGCGEPEKANISIGNFGMSIKHFQNRKKWCKKGRERLVGALD